MGRRTGLGELEQIILSAVARRDDAPYSRVIQGELAELAGRKVSIGTIYVTLTRLENKGYVRSWLADPTPVRGGKAKRVYRATDAGLEAIRRAREALAALWSGVGIDTGSGRA